MSHALEATIEALYGQSTAGWEGRQVSKELLEALEYGEVRAANPPSEAGGAWTVNAWVKKGILIAFRAGTIVPSQLGPFAFMDRDTLPTRMTGSFPSGVRIVPGGTTIRRGAYLGPRVTVMPPAYVNVGAFIGEESMVDSHVLVGSCAQIGKRVHLSAATQVGGVLEPVGALPVIVEDDVFVGGGCCILEGVRIGPLAVLGAGVVLTGSSVLYDVPNARILRRVGDQPLAVPEGAVVVPGTRAMESDFAREHGLAVATPIIIKYRDASTDSKTSLEGALR